MNKLIIEKIIKNGLIEDISYIDAATDILISKNQKSKAVLIAKDSGVLAGVEVFEMVFSIIDSETTFKRLFNDGDRINIGDSILEIYGNTRTILKGERLALNLLQRMSGIATLASEYKRKVEGYNVRIVDTRKTTPNLRILEKYAVKIGGCYNHRYNLSDSMMIKDNHIQAVGSITKAVKIGKEHIPHTMKIEVEVKNIQELKEAVEAEVDIIMLDNMALKDMKEAVKIVNKRAILEASGGINLDNVSEIAKIGIDIISIGALTHSYKVLDISLITR